MQLKHEYEHATIAVQCQLNATQKVEMRGIEPRAFHMQSERSTTELHPLPCDGEQPQPELGAIPGTNLKISFGSGGIRTHAPEETGA